MGQVIAVGIFLTPASMAKGLGSPFWILAVWIVMGGMAACGALCYGELAARFPEAGGGYVYLREAWGPRIAFLYGWKCLLVMDPGITAALATGLAAYAGVLVPLGPGSGKALAIGAVLLLAAFNALGLRIGDGVLKTFTVAKLACLGVLVAWGFASGSGDWGHFVPFVQQHPGSSALVPALAGALIGGFFSFGGWWEAARIAGEVRDPIRTVPRALVLGVSIVTLVYVLISTVFIYLVPMEAVTTGETFAAQAGVALFGPSGGTVLAAVVVVSVLGSLAALMMVLPRVYYAMARDGLFFAGVARLHPRFGTPARAIALQAAVASLLIALGTFEQIVGYFIFVTVAFIGLTVAGVYVLRARHHERGSAVAPAVFLALTVLVLGLLGAGRPRQALVGVLVVAFGVPAYEIVARSRRRAQGDGA